MNKGICPENKCTGCFACANICPQRCISLEENEYGELHPIINAATCINCGLCEKICPSNNLPEFNYPLHCYAAWTKNYGVRRECASGGIGTLLSKYVIENYNGVVLGTKYDKNLVPRTKEAKTIEELTAFKGSKYVQSIVGNDTFQNIKRNLKAGTFVLYIATPCQIAGLKKYLGRNYDNLITVDLLCHGTTPTKYFIEEVEFLKKKHGIKNIDNIRFRGNDIKKKLFFKTNNTNYVLTIWANNSMLYSDNKKPFYLTGFLKGITLRENCYSCSYAMPKRVADITIGDFIGLSKSLLRKYGTNNVSFVTTNTEKGERFYQEFLSKEKDFINIERNYQERLNYGPSLTCSSQRDPLNEEFKKLYIEEGYVKAIREVLDDYMKKLQYQRFFALWTYSYRIPRKVFNILYSKLYKHS